MVLVWRGGATTITTKSTTVQLTNNSAIMRLILLVQHFAVWWHNVGRGCDGNGGAEVVGPNRHARVSVVATVIEKTSGTVMVLVGGTGDGGGAPTINRHRQNEVVTKYARGGGAAGRESGPRHG